MNKGFTLIELIAVIAILAMIAIVAGISYTSINNKHKETSCLNLKKQLENTAIEFVQDKNLLHSISSVYVYYNYETKANDLLKNGYLEEGLKNPINDNELNEIKIKVQLDTTQNYSAKVENLECN